MLQGFGFWQWEALCSVRAGAEDALGEVTCGSCRAGRLGRVPEQTSCVRAVCAVLQAVLLGTSCLGGHSKCPPGPCLCSGFSCWDRAG